jgi:Abnormal spindle-like microcephaly-assoc'd, ASPM-SPD-2-Hydin
MTPTATATATPVGTLSVSGNLSFGKVKVNATKKKTLKVKNKGKFPLQVMIGTLEPPFSVSNSGTFTLGKKKTLTVSVLFKPTVAGPTSAQMLSITSNDPHHLSHPVTATGSGK